MLYVRHRVNSLEELIKLPETYGVEIDLRDDLNGKIYLEHDPFTAGTDFETYLQHYRHGLMILNIKSEGVEILARTLLEQYKIKDYFFLDCSFPMIIRLQSMGEKNVALRFSEYEGIEPLVMMQNKVRWVWIDCFSKIPVDQDTMRQITAMGYKTCFVSPELQGRPGDVESYRQEIHRMGLSFDAVCSKESQIKKWEADSKKI